MPIEIFLAAYAFLGPAHYLTEISWLHEKKYFVNNYWLEGLFTLGTAVAIFISGVWTACVLGALVLSLVLVVVESWPVRTAVFCFGTGVLVILNQYSDWIPSYIAFFIPAIVHVSLFTFLFVLLGFLKRKETFEGWTLITIGAALASFFLFPEYKPLLKIDWISQNIGFLNGMAVGVLNVTNLKGDEYYFSVVVKFISFSYLFHYLNWFSKTRMIGWYQISKFRFGLMTLAYLFFICIYIFDYKMGLSALFFLSGLHVILEFPLNIRSIKDIFS